jgi:hypothetical protein
MDETLDLRREGELLCVTLNLPVRLDALNPHVLNPRMIEERGQRLHLRDARRACRGREGCEGKAFSPRSLPATAYRVARALAVRASGSVTPRNERGFACHAIRE